MTQQQQESQQVEQKKTDEKADSGNIVRRNNRGCKSEDFYNWPEQPFDDMDSPLAVQQYIQQLIHKDPSDIDEILRLPEGQELGAWKIEHLRLFCMQLNRLATKLQDCCDPETCNQMTATEQWIFLCAAHKQPNECPAIDYTRHTLDGAASLLNSNKYFPSRVTIKESSVAKLGSICRRVYRIFSHAYYHHFQVFDEFEKETHLCKRFSKFVTMYQLMTKETLIVPSDGSKPDVETQQAAATTTSSSSSSSTTATTTSTTETTTANTDTNERSQQQDASETIRMDNRADEEGRGSQVKSESSSKKQTTENTAAKGANKTAAWDGPNSSNTNTIVKGLSSNVLIANSTKGSNEVASEIENANTIPTTTSNIPQTNPKNGVESEA